MSMLLPLSAPISPTSRSLTFAFGLGLLLGSAPLLVAAQAPVLGQLPRLAKSESNRSIMLSIGALHNEYDDLPTLGSTPNSTIYSHRSNAAGTEVAYQWAPASARHVLNSAGVGVWAGSETVGIYTGPNQSASGNPTDILGKHTLYEVHLFVENELIHPLGENGLDFSYRLGLHVGELAHLEDVFRTNTVTTTNILPEFVVAIGARYLGK